GRLHDPPDEAGRDREAARRDRGSARGLITRHATAPPGLNSRRTVERQPDGWYCQGQDQSPEGRILEGHRLREPPGRQIQHGGPLPLGALRVDDDGGLVADHSQVLEADAAQVGSPVVRVGEPGRGRATPPRVISRKDLRRLGPALFMAASRSWYSV